MSAEIINRMEDRVIRPRTWRLMHAAAENDACHIVVRDTCHGVTIGCWLSWENDELCVLVPPAEVEEANDALYRVHSLMVLPGLMRAGSDGTLLLPINTGALCSPAGKPTLRDRFLIYGEQERWELVPMLPVSGVQTPRGGIICLVTEGACDAWCEAETDGAGSGTVTMGAMFRRQWVDPVDWTHRLFRYRFIGAPDDLIHTAAKRVRRHVLEDAGKDTLVQRAEASPQCAYQQAKGGGFAGAIGANQSVYFSGRDVQGDVVDCRYAVK